MDSLDITADKFGGSVRVFGQGEFLVREGDELTGLAIDVGGELFALQIHMLDHVVK